MFGNRTGFESLFDEFWQMQREMNRLFDQTTPWRGGGIRAARRGTYPPINVGTTAEQVDIYLFAAGIDPKSIDLTIQNNLLTASGNRNLDTEKEANYYRKERFNGSFHRVVTLPEDVDPEKVMANYQNGVLHVTIQRRESVKPRQIEVK